MPDSTEPDLSPDREIVQRIGYVFDHILGLISPSARNTTQFKIFNQLAKDALKDIALIPDDKIIPMIEEAAHAFMFIANGSMAELEDQLSRNEPE